MGFLDNTFFDGIDGPEVYFCFLETVNISNCLVDSGFCFLIDTFLDGREGVEGREVSGMAMVHMKTSDLLAAQSIKSLALILSSRYSVVFVP